MKMVFQCCFAQILFHEISLAFEYREKPCRLLQSLPTGKRNYELRRNNCKRQTRLAKTGVPGTLALCPAPDPASSEAVLQGQPKAAGLGRVNVAVVLRRRLARQPGFIPVLDIVRLPIEEVVDIQRQ